MADPKARLASLFQGGAASAQGNDALRYVAPKEPTRAGSVAPPPQPTQQQPSPQPTPSAVVFSTTVAMYQYDRAARKYVQMGTSSSTTVGCVVVGGGSTYALLFYNADKTTLCELPVTAWKPTLQPKHYLNFYDAQATNWSVKCSNESAVRELLRQVALAQIHVEIWRPTRSLDANALWKQELSLGTTTASGNGSSSSPAPVVTVGDTVAVEFKCWRVVGNAACAPSDVVTKYSPFEQTAAGDLRKFKLGDGSERIRALDEGVVGMTRGASRLILAPPGKTNGSDWYLLEVTLVKTKSGSGSGSSSRRASASAATTATAAASSSRSGSGRSRRRATQATAVNNGGDMSTARDLVPFQDGDDGDDSNGGHGDQDEDVRGKKDRGRRNSRDPDMELKELRLLQRERQLELQERAMENARSAAGMGNGYASSATYNPYSGTGNSNSNSHPMGMGMGVGFPGSASGRPVDALLLELHAKVDYIIRMAPTNGGGGGIGGGGYGGSGVASMGGGMGATDVQSVMRGVERLAGENERLLLQINSQTHQYASYERRCDELVRANQRLQDEKRGADEKLRMLQDQRQQDSSELASLTSARDAAVTQATRLHGEYQQLLSAFYQKQQATESDEQRQALAFERQARARAEKELSKETQTRALVEQELSVVSQQLALTSKLKDSEVQHLQQELSTLRSEREAAAVDQARQRDAQRELQDTQAQVQLQLREMKTAYEAQETRLQEQHQRQLQLHIQQAQVREQELKQQLATLESEARQSMASVRKSEGGEEEKKEGEEEEGERSAAAVVLQQAQEKEEAALRTLAAAQQLKTEAEVLLASRDASRTTRGDGQRDTADAERQQLVALFKEAVNEMFFRFQDVFEDDATGGNNGGGFTSAQVLGVIRKVLKQSTKDVVARLKEASPSPSSVVAEEQHATEPTRASTVNVAALPSVAEATGSTDDTNGEATEDDEPPPPPMLQGEDIGEGQELPAGEQSSREASEVEDMEEEEGVSSSDDDEEEEDGEEEGDDLLFGAASGSRTSKTEHKADAAKGATPPSSSNATSTATSRRQEEDSGEEEATDNDAKH